MATRVLLTACILVSGGLAIDSEPTSNPPPGGGSGGIPIPSARVKWSGGPMALPELHRAAYLNDLVTIEKLLGGAINRFHVDSRDEDGRTSLVVAATRCHTKVIEDLLRRGARVDAEDAHRRTAFIEAAAHCQEIVLLQLLDAGASLHTKDAHGHTALMAAAHIGHLAGVRLLLDRGADPNAVSDTGKTALDWAREAGKGDVVELLESLGAAGKPAPTADLLPAAVPEPVVAAAPAAADGELGEGAGEL